MGDSLSSLPFPSDEHRSKAVAALTAAMAVSGDLDSDGIVHPNAALQSCVHSEPNVIVHLEGFSSGFQRTILSMTAARACPSLQSPCFLVVMGTRSDPTSVAASSVSAPPSPPPPLRPPSP